MLVQCDLLGICETHVHLPQQHCEEAVRMRTCINTGRRAHEKQCQPTEQCSCHKNGSYVAMALPCTCSHACILAMTTQCQDEGGALHQEQGEYKVKSTPTVQKCRDSI